MTTKITFRVGEPFDQDHPDSGYVPVYDSDGWCRGLARTRRGAEQIKQELEAHTLYSPVLYPVRRET